MLYKARTVVCEIRGRDADSFIPLSTSVLFHCEGGCCCTLIRYVINHIRHLPVEKFWTSQVYVRSMELLTRTR